MSLKFIEIHIRHTHRTITNLIIIGAEIHTTIVKKCMKRVSEGNCALHYIMISITMMHTACKDQNDDDES